MSATDLQSLIMAVGEMRGQMRELIHSSNNNAQALNGMMISVAKLETIPADIIETKALITALDARVAKLEAVDHGRRGVIRLGGWFFQTPMIGWVANAAIAAWLILKGKSGQ